MFSFFFNFKSFTKLYLRNFCSLLSSLEQGYLFKTKSVILSNLKCFLLLGLRVTFLCYLHCFLQVLHFALQCLFPLLCYCIGEYFHLFFLHSVIISMLCLYHQYFQVLILLFGANALFYNLQYIIAYFNCSFSLQVYFLF